MANATLDQPEAPPAAAAKPAKAAFGDDDVKRLKEAIKQSREKLKPFREKREAALREFCGYNYSNNASKDKVPVNFLSQAVLIYLRNLSAKAPKVLCSTKHKELKPQALLLEMAINHLVGKIELKRTLRTTVLNALFSIGIVKVGIETDPDNADGFLHDGGQPFADSVDLDDWVHDMTARRWDQCQYMGNRYRLPLDFVKNSDLYNSKITENLQPTSKFDMQVNQEGDRRTEQISQGTTGDKDDYEPMIELWDLWIPRKKIVITVTADENMKLLRTVKWKGPLGGPYRILAFGEVPNNVMPKAPVMDWLDLHLLGNQTFRKIGRQVERSKTILGVMEGAEKDGERIVKTNDGETVRMDSPDRTKEFRFGGADASNLAFFIKLEDIFSRMAGNLDSLGGLSPQSQTLGQDELLSQSSSKTIADMQDATVAVMKQVIQDIAFYLWHDPLIKLPMTKQESSIQVPVVFAAEDKQGDFYQYDVDIEPYSMQDQSPASRLQSLMNLVQTVFVPLQQQMQQQGVQLDIQGLIGVIAKYGNFSELNDVLQFMGPPSPNAGPQQPQVSQPPAKAAGATQHTSVRVNRPGTTAAGKNSSMLQSLLGAGQQPAEAAAQARPVS